MTNPATVIDWRLSPGRRRYYWRWIVGLVICLAQGVAWGQPDPAAMARINRDMPPLPRIDRAAVQARGLGVHRGGHLTLYSDVRDTALIEDLIASFDSAVPLWCALFQVPTADAREWHLIGCLAAARTSFADTGLWGAEIPDFPAGYNRGYQIWMYPQEGNYYSRHLLLHEGTHAFMQWFLGGSGPPWYSEGMAELVGLHSIENGQLQLRFRPTDRSQVEHWGRPKLIRKAVEAGRRHRLEGIFQFSNSAFRDVENYAWAWAACEFLSSHPRTESIFSRLVGQASDTSPRFNQVWRRECGEEWNSIERDWQFFVDELDYGSEAPRAALTAAEIAPEAEGIVVRLATDRSWQRTGIAIAAGQTVEFQVQGQFQVAGGQRPWNSEGGGITIQYYRGKPLGQLTAALLVESDPATVAPPITATVPIGLGGRVTFDQKGELLLRINESPARMDDNRGQLTVTIRTPH